VMGLRKKSSCLDFPNHRIFCLTVLQYHFIV
jgi:hypothetical protein